MIIFEKENLTREILKNFKLKEMKYIFDLTQNKFLFHLCLKTLYSNDILNTTGKSYTIFQGHSKAVTSLISLPGNNIASVSKDHTALFWDANTFVIKSISNKHDKSTVDKYTTLYNLPEEDSILIVDNELQYAYTTPSVGKWNLRYSRKRIIYLPYTYMRAAIRCLLSLPNKRLALGVSNDRIVIWNKKLSKIDSTIEERAYSLININEKVFASASHDSTVKLWELHTKDYYYCSNILTGHSGPVYCITLFKPGFIISGSEDKTIKVWDLNYLACVKTLYGHDGFVLTIVAYTGRWFMSGSTDKTIKLWDFNTFQCLKTLKGHEGVIYNLVVLEDMRIASASSDTTVRIWDC
jgi:WD40 repeat protein